MTTIPHKDNFCGGSFQDWLEVYLINKCNGNCSWCIDKYGYRPKLKANWNSIAEQAHKVGRKNVILLGGEPTLYKDLQKLIHKLTSLEHDVWITTNGSKLNSTFIHQNLNGITGINVSIHHYNLEKNKDITGIHLKDLETAIDTLHSIGTNVRFNCNCISNYIDSEKEIIKYISWAKGIKVDKIRFVELKDDKNNFIDLSKIWIK